MYMQSQVKRSVSVNFHLNEKNTEFAPKSQNTNVEIAPYLLCCKCLANFNSKPAISVKRYPLAITR